jgi:putative ABC transport system ATP-binding protein
LDSTGRVAEVGSYKELSSNPDGAFSKLMEFQLTGGDGPPSSSTRLGPPSEEEEIEHELEKTEEEHEDEEPEKEITRAKVKGASDESPRT